MNQDAEHFGFDTLPDGKRVTLGTGGFGTTYLGWVEFSRKDQVFNEGEAGAGRIPAALKMINRGQTSAFSLKREVILLSRVQKQRHPCLVNFLSFFYYEYTPVIATELVVGHTLTDEITRSWAAGEPMPEGWTGRVLDWGRQLASAVDCLRALGIIHRDIKPSNIMIRADRRPVLIDFGLGRSAVLQREGGLDTYSGSHAACTPQFASPEQCCPGEELCEACAVAPCSLTAKTDVYSLGATLWFALTRHLPHADRTQGLERGRPEYMQAMARAKRETPPDIHSLPDHPPLRQLLARMLAPDPADRPETSEVHEKFKTILGGDLQTELSTFGLDPIEPEGDGGWRRALPKFFPLAGQAEIAATPLPADAAQYWNPHEVDRIDFDDSAAVPAAWPTRDALELIDAINNDPDIQYDGWRYRLPTINEWRRAAGFRPDGGDGGALQYRRLLSNLGHEYEWCDEKRRSGAEPECQPVCFLESLAPRTVERHRRWPKGVIRLVREPRATPVANDKTL